MKKIAIKNSNTVLEALVNGDKLEMPKNLFISDVNCGPMDTNARNKGKADYEPNWIFWASFVAQDIDEVNALKSIGREDLAISYKIKLNSVPLEEQETREPVVEKFVGKKLPDELASKLYWVFDTDKFNNIQGLDLKVDY